MSGERYVVIRQIGAAFEAIGVETTPTEIDERRLGSSADSLEVCAIAMRFLKKRRARPRPARTSARPPRG